MMCFWAETTTHYFSCKRNHSVVAPGCRYSCVWDGGLSSFLWGCRGFLEEQRKSGHLFFTFSQCPGGKGGGGGGGAVKEEAGRDI